MPMPQSFRPHYAMFIPSIMAPAPPLSHLAAAFLVSARVQEINFHFGHVHVIPAYFRAVADALRDGRITVRVDATAVPSDSEAMYSSDINELLFKTNEVLESARGRASVIHEASHAVADSRGKGTAIRHEEAAAFVCEAWYLDACGIDADGNHNVSDVFFDIAKAMKARATPGVPVPARASEINDGRAEVALVYGYANGYYHNDGF